MNAFAKVDKQTFLRFAAEHAEQRYEFVRGRIVQQMNGGTKKRGRIAMRFAAVLVDQLKDDEWSTTVDRGVADGVFAPPREVRGLDARIMISGRGFGVDLPLARIYAGFA